MGQISIMLLNIYSCFQCRTFTHISYINISPTRVSATKLNQVMLRPLRFVGS